MGLLQPFCSPPPSVLAVRPSSSHLRGTPLCHSQAHDRRFVPSSCHAGISAGVSHISYSCCFLFPRQRWEAPAQVICRARVIVKPFFFIPPTRPPCGLFPSLPLTRGRLPYFLLIESNKETKVSLVPVQVSCRGVAMPRAQEHGLQVGSLYFLLLSILFPQNRYARGKG